MTLRIALSLLTLSVLGTPAAFAYPGGTPSFQTDVAPYCAGCHASRQLTALEGAGDRTTKELVANKHLSVVRAGDPRSGYAELSEADRATLIQHIEAVDEASTVTLQAPTTVEAGTTFEVTVKVTGGAGPVVGVALLDRAHRWYGRPAASAGWQVVGAPKIESGGAVQTDWLDKRPASMGHNLSYVNVTGIKSDAAAGTWASATVTWTLRAPWTTGTLPLAAVYLYGTEKASPLGTVEDSVGRKRTRGGTGGGSGRVLFTPVEQIVVTPADLAGTPQP